MNFNDPRITNAGPTPNRLLATVIRLALMAAAGMIVLAVVLVGFFVVLPVMLVGGIASYFYLRRRVNQARRQRPGAEVIEAEYTIIEHR